MANIYFHTLGCAKNLVESENLAGYILSKNKNLRFVLDPSEADFVIVHTCSFIEPAIKESVEAIRSVRKEILRRKSPRRARVIVTGCLAQVYLAKPDMLSGTSRRIIGDVADFIVGTGALESVEDIINGDAVGKKKPIIAGSSSCYQIRQGLAGGGFHSAGLRLITHAQPWAYLRVAEGCFHRCNYCAIPFIRGDYVSRHFEDILSEARRLSDSGVKELNLISQDTASYGRDLPDGKNIVLLLEEIEKIKGIKWIRLLYSHPSAIGEELIDYISSSAKTLRYLDIPVQHISDNVLRLMGRPSAKKNIINLIERLRRKIKGLVLRTTFIVGHPGETEKDFEELADFVKEGHFLWGGVFAYSRMRGTVSAGLKDVPAVPAEVIEQRRKALLEVMDAASQDFFDKNFSGKTAMCLVTGSSRRGLWVRPWFSAPEVDPQIEIKGAPGRMGISVGDIVKIKVSG